MPAEQQLERSVLERKEREELRAIAQAMSLADDFQEQEGRHHRPDPACGRCRGRRCDHQQQGRTAPNRGRGERLLRRLPTARSPFAKTGTGRRRRARPRPRSKLPASNGSQRIVGAERRARMGPKRTKRLAPDNGDGQGSAAVEHVSFECLRRRVSSGSPGSSGDRRPSDNRQPARQGARRRGRERPSREPSFAPAPGTGAS